MKLKYYLFAKFGLQTDQFLVVPDTKRSLVALDLLWQYASGEKVPEEPLVLNLKGRKKVDVMYVSGVLYAINKKVISVIESAKLTGAKSFPLRIPKCKDSFFGLSVHGKASKPKVKAIAKPSFDLQSWDGNDFFTVDGTQLTIVTSRVYDAFEKAGVTGVYFMPIQAK